MTFYHQFNEHRDETIRRFADLKRIGENRGLVTLKECKVCGNIEWVSTSADGSGYVIEPIESFDDPCGLCRSVAERAPEVYGWVLQVVSFNAPRT